jgi:hypothetical protein
MPTKREMFVVEDAGWDELVSLLESLTDDQMHRVGYYPEWSSKDLLAHIGAWQAEAARFIQQIRGGTYVDEPLDVDAMNERFLDAYRDQPVSIVRAEAWASRTRMITEMNLLQEVNPHAEEWFLESGTKHYDEHLPRLREWVEELRSAT